MANMFRALKQVLAERPKTSFQTTRISKTTFLITEDDEYGEHPFIYAKQHPSSPVLILSDTGCNAPKDKKVKLSNLREYLETYPIASLDGEPINPLVKDADGNIYPERRYIVICTHCHYDHIGGIEAFAGTGAFGSHRDKTAASIVASGYDRDFIEHDLETHFLGGFRDPPIPLPKYKVSHWAKDGEQLMSECKCSVAESKRLLHKADHAAGSCDCAKDNLRITFLHTPGHTPDSLAWYDEDEMCLYTGDSFYERGPGFIMPIIFPKEGNLVTFFASLKKMLSFVREKNEEAEAKDEARLEKEGEADAVMVPRRVKIGAAHQTYGRDAEEMITEILALFKKLVKGEVPIVFTVKVRDEAASMWIESAKAKYTVFMPNRLVDEVKSSMDEILV